MRLRLQTASLWHFDRCEFYTSQSNTHRKGLWIKCLLLSFLCSSLSLRAQTKETVRLLVDWGLIVLFSQIKFRGEIFSRLTFPSHSFAFMTASTALLVIYLTLPFFPFKDQMFLPYLLMHGPQIYLPNSNIVYFPSYSHLFAISLSVFSVTTFLVPTTGFLLELLWSYFPFESWDSWKKRFGYSPVKISNGNAGPICLRKEEKKEKKERKVDDSNTALVLQSSLQPTLTPKHWGVLHF